MSSSRSFQIPGTRQTGFTLVELVLVILILGILSGFALPRYISFNDNAEFGNVRAQASALRSNNTGNELACRLDQPECVDIVSQGPEACIDGIDAFLPELDLEFYTVRNISSDTPRDQWEENLEPGEALYWVTRFLGDDTANHPDESWFDSWNATQPCALSLAD